MDLGPYLAYDGVDYECTICERFFGSETALYAHCRQTSQHLWCERCVRVFVSSSAKDAHIRNSSSHNICWMCPQPQDFRSNETLQDHLVKSHHFCPDCDIYFNSFKKLEEHDVVAHQLCVKCGDYFTSKNSLQMVAGQPILNSSMCLVLTAPLLQHQQKHQPRSMECYGCYQTFKSFSGMLIHLESGNCASRATEGELDDIAHKCYQSRKYINDRPDGGGWFYKCPSCESEFTKLSALYQHAEDIPLCSSPVNGYNCLDKLEHFIAITLQ